jgi:Glycosyl transferases group 1
MIDAQRHKFHFVCRNLQKWPELESLRALPEKRDALLEPGSVYDRITSAEDCWIIQTFLYLSAVGAPVSISSRFVEDAICVGCGYEIGIRSITPNTFVVACRGDSHDPALAQVAVVQNQGMVNRDDTFFIPHWPQPGLIARDGRRGVHIVNVAFKGDRINLDRSFDTLEFTADLARLGVSLRLSGKTEDGRAHWHDYSEDDLVLAVRDLTVEDARVKPASKLVNAWHAGVPALLGPEPAFRELRRTDHDYIEVRTPADVIRSIELLQSNPERYRAMIRNGQIRAQEYTVQKVRDRWLEVLNGPIMEIFAAWHKKSLLGKTLTFPLSCVRHKLNMRKAAWNREHGMRTVSQSIT